MAQLLSGQVTVTTAGTAVAGPSTPKGKLFAISAMPNNVGNIWVGNDGTGDVTSSNGFPLALGAVAGFEYTPPGGFGGLNDLLIDADNNGNKIAWFLLEQ